MNLFKNSLKRIVRQFGFELKRLPRKPNPIHLWEQDKVFNELYAKVEDYTLVDKKRCFVLYQLAYHTLTSSGDKAEIGVYKGGTAYLLATIFSTTEGMLNIFDTFSGMPETDSEKDIHVKGDFSDVSVEGVRAYLKDFNNVKIFQGFFPGSASPVESKKFSFVHVDVDIYKSVRDCCEFFYPRMVRGGVMVFDDYGFLSCPGAKDAVDKFFFDKKENPLYLGTGQCVVSKL